jgi:hypothetical protein
MARLRRYRTGLFTGDYFRFPAPPYNGKGWQVLFAPVSKDAKNSPKGGAVTSDSRGRTRIHRYKEVVVLASSLIAGQRASAMIHAALGLLDAVPGPFGISFRDFYYQPLAFPADRHGSEGLEEEELNRARSRAYSGHNIPLACMVAAKTSFRRGHTYALFKLMLSYDLHCVHTMDLEPRYSLYLPKSPFADDHVRLAQSIVLAYGVLEELGLEIRASTSKPSMRGGKWNPAVKTELEERLRRSRINLSETVLWLRRGPPTRLEGRRPPRVISKAPWAYRNVRDVEVAVIDAIADVSWLRSKVAAHKLGDLAAVLRAYDVSNAQNLARRLLLERLGFWRYLDGCRA